MRILIGGIIWESLTFSPVKAKVEDYGYYRGEQINEVFTIDEVCKEEGIEPVYSTYARCKAAGGWSNREAFKIIRGEILEGIKKAGHLDGICLILHGANQVEGLGCGEENLVVPVRELVGPDMLIAGRYDQHANITQPQAEALNIITIYRTAPHRDWKTRYHDTLRLLAKAIREKQKPVSTYIRIPMLIMGERSTSVTEPMKSLIPLAVEASKEPGIVNADISVGYAWGDVPISGMGVAVSAWSAADLPKAVEIRNRLARAVWDRRNDFQICGEYAEDIDSAIKIALEAPETSVFMGDAGDNASAGAPGDTTLFLEALLKSDVPSALVAGITDEENTRVCFEKGVGATVTLAVGGKLDQEHCKPLTITGEIINLYSPVDVTVNDVRTATLKVGKVLVVLTEQPWAFTRLHQFDDAGIKPLDYKIIVMKVGYLHPEIVDIAPRGYMVLTPGYTPLDLKTLEFHNVIRPIFPLDEDFDWDPDQA